MSGSRILMLSNMYPSLDDPTYGVFVKNIETGLCNNGLSVKRIVIRGRASNLFSKFIKYFALCYRFYRELLKSDYDAIYVHYINHTLLPLVLIYKFTNKPVIINAHGGDVLPTKKLSRYILFLVTPVIRAARLAIVPSDYLKDIVEKRFQFTNDCVFVSPSGGVDLGLFRKTDTSYVDNTYKLVIGCVTRIDRGKGWDVLLYALHDLTVKRPDIHFAATFAGDGADVDKFLQLVKDLSLSDKVKYLGGIPHDQLPGVYNSFDVSVFPTLLNESLGLVGLESLACGVPVIGSRIGALPEYILDGENGLLFEPGNIDALYRSLISYYELSISKKMQFSVCATKTAEKYSSDNVGEALAIKLNSFINTHHGA